VKTLGGGKGVYAKKKKGFPRMERVCGAGKYCTTLLCLLLAKKYTTEGGECRKKAKKTIAKPIATRGVSSRDSGNFGNGGGREAGEPETIDGDTVCWAPKPGKRREACQRKEAGPKARPSQRGKTGQKPAVHGKISTKERWGGANILHLWGLKGPYSRGCANVKRKQGRSWRRGRIHRQTLGKYSFAMSWPTEMGGGKTGVRGKS